MKELSKHDQVTYAMLRRSGLGASEASIYLGVNLYQTVDELIENKRSVEYTDKEREIGEKENVRKGRDLEPLILEKFAEKMNILVETPAPMYRIIEHPQLTINYDGICMMGDQPIPVEAKWVSSYGAKYWDTTKTINTLFEGTPMICGGATIIDHINDEAQLYGVPSYYYTQVQQQMMGVKAPFCYFAVLFDKGWDFRVYKIFADSVTQAAIISESPKVWNRIKPS